MMEARSLPPEGSIICEEEHTVRSTLEMNSRLLRLLDYLVWPSGVLPVVPVPVVVAVVEALLTADAPPLHPTGSATCGNVKQSLWLFADSRMAVYFRKRIEILFHGNGRSINKKDYWYTLCLFQLMNPFFCELQEREYLMGFQKSNMNLRISCIIPCSVSAASFLLASDRKVD